MLEEQTKKMEEKLSALRQQVEEQKKLKESSAYESTLTRWRKQTSSEAPLKDYAKKILGDRKQAFKKYAIDEKKITGSKSFQPALSKINSEKVEKQEKSGLRVPKFKPQPPKEKQVNDLPVHSIQNNFFKAKINTNQLIKQKTLTQFLEQNFLQVYINVLKDNGVHQLQDLYHLSRERMTEMGIKAGHQAKIIKRLKEELSTENKNTENSSRNQGGGEKVSFGYGDGDVEGYNALNEEDEKRKNNEGQQEKQDRGDHNHYYDDNEENNQQSQQEVDEDEQNDIILTMPAMEEFSLQTNIEESEQTQQIREQFNCFQCYRKKVGEKFSSNDGRLFCTQPCLDKYLKFMTKTCPQCNETFFKFEGHFEDGLWFCSLKCCPNQQKIQGMFLQWKTTQKQ